MKKILLTLCLMATCLTLTACSNDSAMTTPTQSPTTQPTTAPTVVPTVDNEIMDDLLPDSFMTDEPLASADPAAAGVSTTADARRLIETVEDELERLSEVDDAQVVISGNSAAVALEFDDQYQGGVDERLRGIVKERINGLIRGIDNVVVTDDAAIMAELESLGDRLEGAAEMTEIQSELQKIIKKIQSALA